MAYLVSIHQHCDACITHVASLEIKTTGKVNWSTTIHWLSFPSSRYSIRQFNDIQTITRPYKTTKPFCGSA